MAVQDNKAYAGAEVWLHAFLTPAACPGRFTPRVEPHRPGTNLAGGWPIYSKHNTLPIVSLTPTHALVLSYTKIT